MNEFWNANGNQILVILTELLGMVLIWLRTSKTTPEQKQQAKKQKTERKEEAKAQKLLAKAKIHAEKAASLREENKNACS